MSGDSAAQRADHVVSRIDETLGDYITWHGSGDSCSVSFVDTEPDNDKILPTGDRLPESGDRSADNLDSFAAAADLSDFVIGVSAILPSLHRQLEEITNLQRERVRQAAQRAVGTFEWQLPSGPRGLNVCPVCGQTADYVSYRFDETRDERAEMRFADVWQPVQVRSVNRTRTLEYEPCGHSVNLPMSY